MTFIFKIPRISKLFIFKDNWDNTVVMREVIAELLHIGQYETVFLGNAPDISVIHNAADCDDCALISLTMQDLKLKDTPCNPATSLFARELKNRKNRFLFESKVVDAVKNVTTIAMSIRMQPLRKKDLLLALAG